MNDPRLFKATRRTIRAEVTLIIFIVISFSWSAYALYKLFVGNAPDGSLLGISLVGTPAPSSVHSPVLPSTQAPPTAHAQVDLLNGHHKKIDFTPDRGIGDTDEGRVALSSGHDLAEQLAQYKRQILKELVARQQQLLAADAIGQADMRAASVQSSEGPNMDQLTRWRRGYVGPSSLDDISAGAQTEPNFGPPPPSQADRVPASSMLSESLAASTGPPAPTRPHLVPLRDAPSLMQLASLADERAASGNQFGTSTSRSKELIVEPENSSDDVLTTTTTLAPLEEVNELVAATTTTTSSTTEAPPALSETTTMEPSVIEQDPNNTPNSDDSEEANAQGDGNDMSGLTPGQQNQTNVIGGEENSEDESENDGDGDGADNDKSMERVRSQVHAIDEEVDRMTQPSLGMASQQDKLFDYKNTVHFDDSPPTPPTRSPVINEPPESDSKSKRRRATRRLTNETSENDLQVVDSRSRSAPSPSIVQHIAQLEAPLTTRSRIKWGPERRANTTGVGVKSTVMSARSRRSVEANLISQTLDAIDAKKKGKKKNSGGASRRQDGDEDDDDSGDQEEGEQGEDEPNDKSNYQYITSNDPTLQDLLAHKQLLDALQQSKLPAPVSSSVSAGGHLQSQSQRLNSSFLDPQVASPLPQTLGKQQTSKTTSQDRQPADTHYTVDHGLLLYPAEGEEHGHKSSSKKSKKMAEKKGKKKMTVAVKKGGHKKKKHKKEEKKYVKEKKFKGAKKGKKMSKGKGGKGGKKGKKFYKDKGFKKKGFKNIYVKNEFGQKKSYFDEFRDKDFKKKWKNYDDKYKYANMKKWQAKDVKGAKKMKDHGEQFKKYDKGKWKKKYHKHQASESAKKKKKYDEF